MVWTKIDLGVRSILFGAVDGEPKEKATYLRWLIQFIRRSGNLNIIVILIFVNSVLKIKSSFIKIILPFQALHFVVCISC